MERTSTPPTLGVSLRASVTGPPLHRGARPRVPHPGRTVGRARPWRTPLPSYRSAQAGLRGEGGLDDVQGLAEQVLTDHQRRQEAQHVAEGARSQDDDAL